MGVDYGPAGRANPPLGGAAVVAVDIGAIPAVVVLVTLTLGAVWTVGRAAPWPAVRRGTPAVILASLGAIGFLNINTYFGEQASHPEVYASFSTVETLMARHMLEQQRHGYSLFVSRQFKHGLTTALLANEPRYDVIRAPTGVPIDPADVRLGASIYLEPREGSVYRLLRAYYPDARFEIVRPPGGGDVLYHSAVLSREQLESPRGLVARYSLLDGRRILDGGRASVLIEPAVGLHALTIKARVEELPAFLRLSWQPLGGELTAIGLDNLFHGEVRPMDSRDAFTLAALSQSRRRPCALPPP